MKNHLEIYKIKTNKIETYVKYVKALFKTICYNNTKIIFLTVKSISSVLNAQKVISNTK